MAAKVGCSVASCQPLGVALKGIDAQALAESYVRREGDQALVVAAGRRVLQLIRGALRRKRGAR